MGYRSQVACCISVDTRKEVIGRHPDGYDLCKYTYDKTKFKEMIGFIKLTKFWELFSRDADQDAIGWGDGKFFLYGEGWKWYPDYEDVKEFHKMFNQMGEIEGISGYFLRVGEEHGDVEEESFGDDPCQDYFYSFQAMNFNAPEYLGKRNTDEEEQNTQSEPNLPTPTSQGNENATPEA